MNASDNSQNSYINKLKNNMLNIFRNKKKDLPGSFDEPTSNQQSDNLKYVFSFIAISSKLAEIDSEMNNLELQSIVKNFPASANFNLSLEKIVIAACKDQIPFESHVEKIKKSFKGHRFLYVQTLEALVKIALIDGHLNESEMTFLQKTAAIFKITNAELVYIFKKELKMNWSDNELAYNVLGVLKHNSEEEVIKKYHSLVKDCHPDILVEIEDVSTIYLNLLQEKFQRITESYQLVKKSFSKKVGI